MFVTPAVFLTFLFIVKHYIADFQFQTSWMYLNKGKWMHPGGLVHAAMHGILTFACLVVLGTVYGFDSWNGLTILFMWFGLGVFDFVVHYVVDWLKVNLTAKYKWAERDETKSGNVALCIYSNKFFIALGVDQMLHWFTYVIIMMFVV